MTDYLPEEPSASLPHHSGYVSLVGKPNAGKSTLLNALIGRKLSIVTHRPQTTRHRVLGILSEPDTQIVFLDTPGLLEPRYLLQQRMMEAVGQTLAESDLVLFVADSTYTPDPEGLERLEHKRALLVLSKVDLLTQDEVMARIEAWQALHTFEAIVPVSAITPFNLERLLQEIRDRLPLGPKYYPEDQLSEHPERFFVAEFIREKIFEYFRQEIPYATQVNIVVFEEREGGKDFIDAEIVVERETQKGILIGKGGKALKHVGMAARKEIEAFTERPVFLRLHVKVRDDWRNKDVFLKSYGY